MTVRTISILLSVAGVFGNIAPVSAADWFHNKDQVAEKSFQAGEFDAAAEGFDDAYRRGVSLYRAEKYADAAREFSEVERPSVASAGRYNLGNSHFKLEQYDKAIEAYESIAEDDPLYDDARFNLELARQLMQEQDQEKSQQGDDGQSDEPSGESSEESSDQQKDGDPSESSSEGDQSEPDEADESENSDSEQSSDAESETGGSERDTPPSDAADSQPPSVAEDQSEAAPQFDQQQAEAVEGAEDETNQPSQALSQPVPVDAATAEQNQLAEQWLNRVGKDPSRLLKNQFYITEQEAETKSGAKPW